MNGRRFGSILNAESFHISYCSSVRTILSLCAVRLCAGALAFAAVLLMFQLIMRRNDIIYLIYLCCVIRATRLLINNSRLALRIHLPRTYSVRQKLLGACSANYVGQTCSADKNRFDERRRTKWQLFVVFNSFSGCFFIVCGRSHKRLLNFNSCKFVTVSPAPFYFNRGTF